ncbi:MAG: hypothetical protein MJ245_05220 [Clostridia bacterium]|nr:hypothetical protein [Clostridia bacterium]
MNRKFRELIPLFAIALMIIAAIAFLIIINTDGKKAKKTTVVENKEKTTTVEKVEIEEENKLSEEDLEEEVAEPVAKPIDVEDKETTTTKTTTKTATTLVKNTQPTKTTSGSVTSSDYISNMVGNIMGGTATANTQNTSNMQTKPQTTTTNVTTNTQTTTVTTNTNTNTQTTYKPATTQTITQSKPQAANISNRVVYSSATAGSYKVAIVGNNKIVTYKSNGIIIDEQNISSNADITKVNGNKIYCSIPGSGVRQYTISSYGYLTNDGTVSSGQSFQTSGNYVYVYTNVGSVIAYDCNNGFGTREIAVLNIPGGIASIESVSGRRVTVETNKGKSITYILDGASFTED